MTELEISHSQFPNALAPDLKVGDVVLLTVEGHVIGIHDDQVDITPMGGPPAYVSGERVTRIAPTHIRQIIPAEA